MKDNNWLPIDSAPIDGTEILVYCQDDNKQHKVAFLDINDNHLKPKVRADVYTCCMQWVVPESISEKCGYYVIANPTHWMSLPTKPNNYDLENFIK